MNTTDLPSSHLPVFLVDDDEIACKVMSLTLREARVNNVQIICDSRQVLPFLKEHGAALVLLDLFMPHLSGQELLKAIRHEYPDVQVVVISGANELNIAVECMKQGALDYLSKPVEASRLIACVSNALRINAMQGELLSLKKRLLEDSLEHPDAFAAIKTRSNKMRALFQYVEVVARSQQPILITGETGVGKELIAHAVHSLSQVNGDFISVNVAGLDDATFSDTLFGHKKGAFTGADQAREGLISRAAGGTLFLDEIGDLEERSQIKLMRLLQEGEYYQVGSDLLKKSTAHIVAATNQNLVERVAQKQFRRDLLYRLSTHTIHIPPLRDRLEDIPLLVAHFLTEAATDYHKEKPIASDNLVACLIRHAFPGNVRELKAMIYDAVARYSGGDLMIQPCNGQWDDTEGVSDRGAPVTMMEQNIETVFGHFPTVDEAEEYLINEALRRTAGNLNLAAAMLGITRQTVTNRRRKLSSTPEKTRKFDLAPMEDLFNV